MFDDQTNRSKIVAAAMKLAEEYGWRDLSLGEIAAAAGLGLADLRKEFGSKTEILSAFRAEVDKAVLSAAGSASSGEGPRDRLFDVMMTRFEVMTPYRLALRRILADMAYSPGEAVLHFLPAMSSQYWMLEAAGISAEGSSSFRVPGLAAIYAQVFRVWLRDDDPGLAQTMAALDRRLRRAENLNMRIKTLCEAGEKALSALSPGYRWTSSESAGGGGSAELKSGGAPEASAPVGEGAAAGPQSI